MERDGFASVAAFDGGDAAIWVERCHYASGPAVRGGGFAVGSGWGWWWHVEVGFCWGVDGDVGVGIARWRKDKRLLFWRAGEERVKGHSIAKESVKFWLDCKVDSDGIQMQERSRPHPLTCPPIRKTRRA